MPMRHKQTKENKIRQKEKKKGMKEKEKKYCISVLTNNPVNKQQAIHLARKEEVERNEKFSNIEGCGLLADDSAI